MSISREIFINDFVREIKADNAAIFAGAGLSVPAGIVNWKELIKPLADELNLDVNREHDLIAIAQYHYNRNGHDRGYINQQIIDKISGQGRITPCHEILARLPIKIFWTTNYDKLLERSFEDIGKVVDVKHSIEQLATTIHNRNVVLCKMHGDVGFPAKTIVTKDDYESYHVTMYPFINALTGDLISKTFLFIGLSFSDPNLDYILSRVRIAIRENKRRHFCMLKRILREEYANQEDYEYSERKQSYMIEDLKRIGIRTVLLNGYDEIADILKRIEIQLKQKAIFISSAISDYSRYSQEVVIAFLQQLSSRLIVDGYSIVTGYGLGVGNAIIQGAFNEIYVTGRGREEQLVIKPFPQIETADKRELWTLHRNNIISNCGVAIFLFGNKKDDHGAVIHSSGMREEFNIAKQNGAYLIPVGETGYMAKELYDETLMFYDKYNSRYNPKAKEYFDHLSIPNNDLSETVHKIMAVLNTIN